MLNKHVQSIAVLIIISLTVACRSEKRIPDVSNINVNLPVLRLEQDFFSIDTNNIVPSLQNLHNKYQVFLNDYMVNILGLPLTHSRDTSIERAIKKFISDYRMVKDTAEKVFPTMEKPVAEIKEGLRFVKYYFPKYKLPEKLFTFLGPLDAYYQGSLGSYGDILTTEGFGVGLQLHLGKNYSLYKTETGQEIYPSYISRRFEAPYISVNCIKNIIDDLYPEKGGDRPLIDQMIEKGKRMYLLDKFMPYMSDTLKTGYTKKQLDGCYKNEGVIWNFFLQNNLIYSIEPSVNKNYIQDGPKTEELGEASPGFIGLFVGWQIVKKYMSNNETISLATLMETDTRKIFEDSKYKPR